MGKKKVIYLDYYTFMKKIKKSRKEITGTFFNKEIHVTDPRLVELFTSDDFRTEGLDVERKKKKCDVIDAIRGVKIGELDVGLNLFNNNNRYIGTLRSKNKLLILIVSLFLLLMGLSFGAVSIIKSSQSQHEPIDITISESDGTVLEHYWNVFGRDDEDKIIYPGKSGEYYIKITNNNSYDLLVDLTFSENNEHEVPMVFRIVDSSGYLSGNDSEYVDIDDINESNIFIKSKESKFFILEWKWESISDEDDTEIGLIEDAQYVFMIKLDFKEYIEEDK